MNDRSINHLLKARSWLRFPARKRYRKIYWFGFNDLVALYLSPIYYIYLSTLKTLPVAYNHLWSLKISKRGLEKVKGKMKGRGAKVRPVVVRTTVLLYHNLSSL